MFRCGDSNTPLRACGGGFSTSSLTHFTNVTPVPPSDVVHTTYHQNQRLDLTTPQTF